MRFVLYAFWLLVIVIGITFASLNPHPVTINYYIGSSTLRLPLLLMITLVTGALLGIVAMLLPLLRNKHSNRRLRNRVRQIEQEVQNLRTIPIKDNH